MHDHSSEAREFRAELSSLVLPDGRLPHERVSDQSLAGLPGHAGRRPERGHAGLHFVGVGPGAHGPVEGGGAGGGRGLQQGAVQCGAGLPREPAGGFGAEGPARRGGRASAGAAPCRPGPHQRPPHGGHAGGDSNPLAGQARLGCARNREGEEGRHRPKGKETHLKASKKALAAFGSHAIAQCVQRGFGARLILPGQILRDCSVQRCL
mmetsp:Transcript_82427/g.197773  ORF Transcript_82427/g.197773 Transcript_82427/m.197773 type:complete len:208 (-) Transcript_82427:74-697(-)